MHVIYDTLAVMGRRHAGIAQLIVDSLLESHPRFIQTEPRLHDNIGYVALLIFFYSATQHNSNLYARLPAHTDRHFAYLRDRFPQFLTQKVQQNTNPHGGVGSFSSSSSSSFSSSLSSDTPITPFFHTATRDVKGEHTQRQNELKIFEDLLRYLQASANTAVGTARGVNTGGDANATSEMLWPSSGASSSASSWAAAASLSGNRPVSQPDQLQQHHYQYHHSHIKELLSTLEVTQRAALQQTSIRSQACVRFRLLYTRVLNTIFSLFIFLKNLNNRPSHQHPARRSRAGMRGRGGISGGIAGGARRGNLASTHTVDGFVATAQDMLATLLIRYIYIYDCVRYKHICDLFLSFEFSLNPNNPDDSNKPWYVKV